MRNLFDRRDPWGHGWALWIFVAMIFATPVMLLALRGLRLKNDIEAWLPEDDPTGRTYAWYKQHFPHGETILITWDDATLEDPRIGRLSEALLGQVDADGRRRGGVPYVDSVVTPQHLLARITEQGVEPDDAAERIEGLLIGRGQLKVRLTDAGREAIENTKQRLEAIGSEQLQVAISINNPVEVWFDEAHDDLYMDAADDSAIWAPEIPAHDLQITWRGIDAESPNVNEFCRQACALRGFATSTEPDGRLLVDECFFASGSPVAVAAMLSEAGESDLSDAVAAVRDAAIAVGVAPAELHLGGRPVASVALNAAVKRAAVDRRHSRLMIHRRSVLLTSGLIGIALALFFLRSFKLGFLVIGVTYFAALAGVAVIPLTGHTMNMVLIVMPTLLMVLALSGAIHLANYWKHAAHEDPATAVSRATAMARQPCLMASFTTAIGLMSLATSSLAPVREFGIFSAIGCLIGVATILYGLPAMLQILGLTAPAVRERDTRMWTALGQFVGRRPWFVAGVCCAVGLVTAMGLTRFETDTRIIKNFPDDSPLLDDYRFLEQNLSGITPVDTVVRFTPEAQQQIRFLERVEIVRQVEAEIREHKDVSGTMSLASFLPVREPPADADSFRVKAVYNKRSNETERRIKDGQAVGANAYFAVCTDRYDLAESGDGQLSQPGDELWRISAQLALLSDVNYGRISEELGERVQRVTRYHPGTSHAVTGTAPLFHRTQQAVVKSLIWSFGLAFVIIGAVLLWVLKNPLAAGLSMIPNILPVLSVFGLISWCGQSVDIGAMITASVALGIAVDGTLHLLTWFQDGLQRGYSRRTAVTEALNHCAPAMWQTSVAVGLGLLMLAPAELRLISRFGWLMSALVGAALIADLILLPALLAGPLGAVLERSVKKNADAEEAAKTQLNPPHVAFEAQRTADAEPARS